MIGSLFNFVTSRRVSGPSLLMLWMFGVAVVVVGCGGGALEDSGSTIVSPDGMATLVIPEGSLPADVSIEDIEIVWTDVVSDDPGAPFSAVALTPSGLSLSEPATLRVEIPDTVSQLLVVHSAEDGFEFIGAGLEPAGDKLVATIELSDFSFVDMYDANLLSVTAQASPSPTAVGDVQLVSLEIAVSDAAYSGVQLWMHLGNQFEPKYQLFEFRVDSLEEGHWFPPVVRWTEGGGLALEDSEHWSPNDVEAEVVKDNLSLEMLASSRCQSPVDDDVSNAAASIGLQMSLLAKGEVIDGLQLGLRTLFDSTDRDTYVSRTSHLNRTRYDVQVGETVKSFPSVHRTQPAECLATSDTGDTSSTSSATLPPAGEGPTSFTLIGSPSDVTCEDSGDTLDPALTIVGATFVQDGDEVVVTITFEGDAEAYEEATTDTFPVAVQFRLKAGGPYPEAYFGDKGKLKVSGGLLQIVSHEFSGDTLTIRLKGRTLEDVKAVQVSTFVYAGGECLDLLYSDGYND